MVKGWRFIFKSGGTRIVEKHKVDEEGNLLKTSSDALSMARRIAEKNGWLLIAVEEL